jgi:hypothetical protein
LIALVEKLPVPPIPKSDPQQMNERPKDPWGNDYGYGWPAANEADNFPDLSSSGPDGKPSREDDIVYVKRIR